MNPAMLPLIWKGANTAFNYLKSRGDERERDIYSSLLEGLKNDNMDKIHDELDVPDLERAYGTARANAGDITRDLHDRLDARRSNFAATAPARKAYREELLKEAKGKKKEGKGFGAKIGKALGVTLGLAAAGAGAWALYQYLTRDDARGNEDATADYVPAGGSSKLVYSTTTEDARQENGKENGQDNQELGDTGARDLGREGLSSLDTLDDDQRDATK